MIALVLSPGRYCLVDDQDYLFVSQYRWFAAKSNQTYYAQTNVRKSSGGWRSLRMHNLLIPHVLRVDHHNHNGLDNRRINLRESDSALNRVNSKSSCGISKFKGVCPNRSKSNPWKAVITVSMKSYHLGCFKTENDAAREYNRVALLVYGEHAYLNKVEGLK